MLKKFSSLMITATLAFSIIIAPPSDPGKSISEPVVVSSASTGVIHPW